MKTGNYFWFYIRWNPLWVTGLGYALFDWLLYEENLFIRFNTKKSVVITETMQILSYYCHASFTFSIVFVWVFCCNSCFFYTNRQSQVSVNNTQTTWGVMAAPLLWCCAWMEMRERRQKDGGLLSIKFWYPVRQLHFIIINCQDGNWGFVISQHNREVSKSKMDWRLSWQFNIKGTFLKFPNFSLLFYLKFCNKRRQLQNAWSSMHVIFAKKYFFPHDGHTPISLWTNGCMWFWGLCLCMMDPAPSSLF